MEIKVLLALIIDCSTISTLFTDIFFRILLSLADVTNLGQVRWLIIFCMLLIPFPEIIPVFTDQILISEK